MVAAETIDVIQWTYLSNNLSALSQETLLSILVLGGPTFFEFFLKVEYRLAKKGVQVALVSASVTNA